MSLGLGVNIKAAYVVLVVLFYVSIPVMPNLTEIIFWARGYDRELVFENKDAQHDEERNARYYAAYKKEAPLIVFVARSIVAIWILTLVFSVTVFRKGISFPFRLEIITGVISFLLILAVVLPIIIFGRGWPPRPL